MQHRKGILNIRTFSACTIQKDNKINLFINISLNKLKVF